MAKKDVQKSGSKPNPKVYIIKAATEKSLIEASAAAAPEDDFTGSYWDGTSGEVICPPYDMLVLKALGEKNNTLAPCVTAYVNNIDGSGYVLEKQGVAVDRTAEDADKDVVGLYKFFDEVSPKKSLLTLRKELRNDVEYTGNAFLEVVRNVEGDIVFVNRVPSYMMRIVKLDAPVPVKLKIIRLGAETEVMVSMRQRRFVQKVGADKRFFKEFGVEREVHRVTGEWSKDALTVSDRGNEIIHFIVEKSATSPYGVPRWVNQIPSIVGSRKAEEANLEYFDSGGIPPVLIFLSGGTMSEPVRKQLLNIFNAKLKNTNRGAVVEVTPTGGSIDKDSKVDVKVEKFGAEAMSDSMYENYDDKCDKRVRKSFRLPPLFTGSPDDNTFASVEASYLVAEAQVFMPERVEFDEIWNMTVMRSLDKTGTIIFRSKQTTVKDIQSQLKGLVLAKGMEGIPPGEYVAQINETCSLNLSYDDKLAKDQAAEKLAVPAKATPAPTAPAKKIPAKKSEIMKTEEILGLVDDFLTGNNLVQSKTTIGKDSLQVLHGRIDSLSTEDRTTFTSFCSSRLHAGESYDVLGSRDLMDITIDELIEAQV